MAISLYDISVRSFLQTLGGVAGYLEKAKGHLGDGAEAALDLRLHADMWPLRAQVISVEHHSRGAIAGVQAGVFRPPNFNAEYDYAGLQALIADAISELKALTPEAVNALEGKDMVFELGPRQMPFVSHDFLQSFSLPNFHFHATTAYGILRHAGVPLGKRDYLGAMRIKA